MPKTNADLVPYLESKKNVLSVTFWRRPNTGKTCTLHGPFPPAPSKSEPGPAYSAASKLDSAAGAPLKPGGPAEVADSPNISLHWASSS
ncbi:hypothetical protein Y1Q_0023520 [Alligator mississippiensis]|uniref:Uncharacterized protein n=1 Tax=Alligator mississippiensis TaxID=8496 RepID=A0A151NQ10_ALLMI|nr:hypothetical protein Y1Q_0023520 [Alligator mississippiensis]